MVKIDLRSVHIAEYCNIHCINVFRGDVHRNHLFQREA